MHMSKMCGKTLPLGFVDTKYMSKPCADDTCKLHLRAVGGPETAGKRTCVHNSFKTRRYLFFFFPCQIRRFLERHRCNFAIGKGQITLGNIVNFIWSAHPMGGVQVN